MKYLIALITIVLFISCSSLHGKVLLTTKHHYLRIGKPPYKQIKNEKNTTDMLSINRSN